MEDAEEGANDEDEDDEEESAEGALVGVGAAAAASCSAVIDDELPHETSDGARDEMRAKQKKLKLDRFNMHVPIE
jgi:hypothetical protein